jgi:rRNA maturation endonuclease Nob1
MSTTHSDAPVMVLRCDGCDRAYYDDNYRGEPCRECGRVL